MCDHLALWPQPVSAVCSGGVCLTAAESPTGFATCACGNPVWSPTTDFIKPDSHSDCDVHLRAVSIMWLFTAFAQVLSLGFSGVFVWKRHGFALPPMSALGKIDIYTLGCAISSTLMLVVSALKSSSFPSRTIGNDALTTVLFCAGAWIYWTHNLLFMDIFLRLAIKGARLKAAQARAQEQRLAHVSKTAIPVVFLMIVVGAWAPALLLAVPSDAPLAQTQPIAATHFLGLSCVISALGLVLVPHYVGDLIREIQGVLSSSPPMTTGASNTGGSFASRGEKLVRVLAVLTRFVKELKSQAAQQTLLAIVFGCIPFMTRKAAYELPVAWFSAAFVNVIGQRVIIYMGSSTRRHVGVNGGDDHDTAQSSTGNDGGGHSMTSGSMRFNRRKDGDDVTSTNAQTTIVVAPGAAAEPGIGGGKAVATVSPATSSPPSPAVAP